MFIAYIASPCDSYYDVICTHYISLWFQKRCYVHTTHYSYDSKDDVIIVHTSHQGYDLSWFLFSTWHHGYGSRNDLMCTHNIRVMIPYMISCVHIAPCLWLRDDFISQHNSIVMICYDLNRTIESSHESSYISLNSCGSYFKKLNSLISC